MAGFGCHRLRQLKTRKCGVGNGTNKVPTLSLFDGFSSSDTPICPQADCQVLEWQGGAHCAAARTANDHTLTVRRALGQFASAAVQMVAM